MLSLPTSNVEGFHSVLTLYRIPGSGSNCSYLPPKAPGNNERGGRPVTAYLIAAKETNVDGGLEIECISWWTTCFLDTPARHKEVTCG